MVASSNDEQLVLFDFGGIDLSALREELGRLEGLTAAPLTVRGYASDWKMFDNWCVRAGKRSLPATEDTVRLYLAWLLGQGRKATTAERHVSAIANYHKRAKLESPVSAKVRQVLSAVRRERKEKPEGKTALDADDLVKVAKSCDPLTNVGLRDRAIIVLGFATSLRRSNLAQLELADVTFHKPGLGVSIRSSKTDQEGRGRNMGVWAGERSCTDPVGVLRSWIEARGNWPGPLFARITVRGDLVMRYGVTGDAINEIVKRAVARAGIDPAGYGAHSLRAGAITASAKLGRSNQELMGLSGHRSEKMIPIYVRGTRIFAGRDPLAGVL